MDSDIMFWLGAAVVAAVIEGITASMVSLWFAAGAVAAMTAGIFTDSFVLQICVFIAVSAAGLLLFRERFIKRTKDPVATNADRVIGKEAGVVERIDNRAETGTVKVDGMLWTARADRDDSVFEEGSFVTVSEIRGSKLIVKELSKRPDEKSGS